MKKFFLLMTVAAVALTLTSCDLFGGGDSLTPEGSKTQLWLAGESGSSYFGYINKSGDMVIPADFDDVESFSCGYALVHDPYEGYYYINTSGKCASNNMPYADVVYSYFYQNVCSYGEDGLVGMMDTNFKSLFRPKFTNLGYMTADGLAWCDDEGELGYCDKNGKVQIRGDFNWVSAFSKGIAIVSEDGEYHIIDKNGKKIFSTSKALYNLGEGRVAYYNSNSEKWGIMDSKGEQLTSAQFTDIYPFSNGLALVERNDKYGFIDKSGELVIPASYISASNFSDGCAWVLRSEGSKWQLIDKSGNELWTLKAVYTPYSVFQNGLALIVSDDKALYVDKNSDIVYSWSISYRAPMQKMANMTLKERNIKMMQGTECGMLMEEKARLDKFMQEHK